ncbi:focadhesin [Protopterus annectens]|uniref:focadhesin n=1 Tax=Protopterus annectens TaxID=7888 RepID=UPI001CFBD571|nr:focadhesin [Protopterus annectens]
MTEELRKRFEFPNSLIQSQAAGHLIAAVLKEKGSSDKIIQSSNQTPALNLLWEKCSSDNVVVRTVCCEALVALVVQQHADFGYILNGILNLIPSASDVQGLVKALMKLLQLLAVQMEEESKLSQSPYSVRSPPHPLITVLENRPQCWPVILQQISAFFQHCPERAERASVLVMLPFLRYLYCEPSHLQEYAQLRISLLKVLLQLQAQEKEPSVLEMHIFRLFLDLIPYLQLNDLTQVTEATLFVEELCSGLLRHVNFWKTELCQLSLQLLCISEVILKTTGECSSLIQLSEQIVDNLQQDFPCDQVVIGLCALLLQAPASQQKPMLRFASKIVSCSGSKTLLVLVMPLLQIVSSASVMDCLSEGEAGVSSHELAVNLLRMVQSKVLKEQKSSAKLQLPVTTWWSSVFATWRILCTFQENNSTVGDWLSSVRTALSLSTKVSEHFAVLIAYLIINEDGEQLRQALSVATELAKADSSQVPNLVPVLMFKLGKPMDPTLCQAVLYTLPALGTHKVCVAQILRALQFLGSKPKLRGTVLRLITSLWEKQDRVYPELQRFMGMLDAPSLSVGKDDQWEQMIAKAASMRDICRQRSYQHGADMLAAVSQVLSECTRPDHVTPAVLALQGLHALCQAEVVDIRSTWNALCPKLSCDTRPLLLKALNEFFALVPSLEVKSTDYEKFRLQIVSLLWNHAQSKDAVVAASAFKALSEFRSDEHTILHLPEQARPERKAVDDEEMEMNEADDEQKEEDLSVPGTSYIKLLSMISPAVYTAFEEFLTSLVKQEMAKMPRGIYHSALRSGAVRSDQGKTVSGIPRFMLKMYEKNKQPGLKPGLAAGMLLSFEHPIQTDREGRPITRFLVTRGRNYQQMVSALIHEVQIQPSEWHRAMVLPHAWHSFMGRAYNAALQGQHADLEMLLKRSKEDPQEIQYKKFTAWLWVRDALTDLVQSSSKDSPGIQGNCILALTGLAVTVAKHESSLPSETEGEHQMGDEFLPTRYWISMVLDTLLSIIDSRYRPKGRVFPWFRHVCYQNYSTDQTIVGLMMLSNLSASCARTSEPVISDTVIVTTENEVESTGFTTVIADDDSESLQQICLLCEFVWKFSAVTDDEAHATTEQFCQKYSDVAGQKINLLLMKTLDALEDCCFDSSLEYNTGCILGVGLVLSVMSQSSQTESRAHVSSTLRKLCSSLEESTYQSRMVQEVLAYTVACVSVCAFNATIIQASEAEEIMNNVRNLTEQNQQTTGFAVALGIIVHGFLVCGHGKAEDLSNRLLPAWIKILLAEGCPTMQRLAAVNGLCALVGSEDPLIQLKSDVMQSTQFQNKLNEVIRSITQVISFSGVIGLQSNAAYLLGHLHLGSMSSSQSRTSVPPDFGYLPEISFIRAAGDYVIEAGKKGPESVSLRLMKVVMGPLAEVGNSYQYPPINWAAVLSPLMRLNFGVDVQQQCIELAVSQAQSAQSTALFLGMWLSPPLVNNLSPKTKKYLFTSLPVWIKHAPEDKLQSFIETFAVQFFTAEKSRNVELCLAILEGLGQAMKLPSPAQHSWGVLCRTTEKIFEILPNKVQQEEAELYFEISKCLSEVSDTEIDRITVVSKENVEKATLVRAYLVSQGRVPFLGLNDVLNVTVGYSQKEAVSWMLLQSFFQARLVTHPNTGVLTRVEWLLELMGHIRNIAYGSTPVSNASIKEAADFLLLIFAAAVASWADFSIPLLLGVSANWLPWKQQNALLSSHGAFLGHRLLDVVSVHECLSLLPQSIQLLLAKEPWKEQTQKFIDWLFTLLESPKKALTSSSRNTVKATLLALKFLPEFKKKAVWTRAYGW